MSDVEVIKSGATISACGKYRYRLWRQWDECAAVMVFCMMNPSTADAENDDNTIRRCIGFARRERHGGILVVNVFAYRATDSSDLLLVEDPVGPENQAHLEHARSPLLSTLVAAWGNRIGGKSLRPYYIRAGLAMAGLKAKCLGVNKDGSPKHPLYVPAVEPLVHWNFR